MRVTAPKVMIALALLPLAAPTPAGSATLFGSVLLATAGVGLAVYRGYRSV